MVQGESRSFLHLNKETLHAVCVNVHHQVVLRGAEVWRWLEVFWGKSHMEVFLYSKPAIEKRTADLQLRLVHKATATNRHVAHLATRT